MAIAAGIAVSFLVGCIEVFGMCSVLRVQKGRNALLPNFRSEASSDLEERWRVCGCMSDLVSFLLFSKYYHQSYWPPMMYVEPVLPPSPVEVYPSYTEPAPALDQSVPQLYTDAGRTGIHQVPLEAPPNG